MECLIHCTDSEKKIDKIEFFAIMGNSRECCTN